MIILDVKAIEILDSRGNPTLQVEVVVEDGSKGRFTVPSGASTGIHEAHELRDENKNVYHGKSVQKAVNNVNGIINGELVDKNFTQKSLDEFLIKLDGTENKELLGANAILGVSIAFAKASAKYYNLPTYEYLFRLINGVNMTNKKFSDLGEVNLFANVINGGLHSGNALNIQEFMIIPCFGTMQEKVRAIVEIYQCLKVLIENDYGKSNTAVGDEGGFAPEISLAEQALSLLVKAVREANYEGQVCFALDAAASDFYDSKSKKYEVEKNLSLDYKKLTDYYNKLIEKYPLISIEDPFAEDDFEAFEYFRTNIVKLNSNNYLTCKKEVLIIGDDLLVTNPKRISIAKEKKLCNALLLKINQIGSLSESIEAFKMAKESNWHTIVSHRSGETCDDFISDLATAMNSSIKLGAPARGERVAKYNRLLNIFS
ncbi:MAG: phosphopyruvate hydratase [Nanoarchaeota archaeon]|nr:phosphopyruvate hydratase [Nanoarchaeota archaeon]